MALRVSDREISGVSANFVSFHRPIPMDAQSEARYPRVDYTAELQYGLTNLAANAYAEELADGNAVARNLANNYEVHRVSILASMNAEVLRLIAGRNLSRETHLSINRDLRDIAHRGTK